MAVQPRSTAAADSPTCDRHESTGSGHSLFGVDLQRRQGLSCLQHHAPRIRSRALVRTRRIANGNAQIATRFICTQRTRSTERTFATSQSARPGISGQDSKSMLRCPSPGHSPKMSDTHVLHTLCAMLEANWLRCRCCATCYEAPCYGLKKDLEARPLSESRALHSQRLPPVEALDFWNDHPTS